MTLILTKKYSVPSINQMNYLATTKIFEKLTYEQEKELERGISLWVRKKDLHRTEKKSLYIIINALESFESNKGQWARDKENFKRCDIDYKKVYPEGIC